MTGLTVLGTAFFIILWIIIGIQLEAMKKLKEDMKKESGLFKHKNNVAHQDLQLVQFHLREVSSLKTTLKTELSKIKKESSFVQRAIKEKVSKKKIRGKRRKSA
jgi:hypothetical protein